MRKTLLLLLLLLVSTGAMAQKEEPWVRIDVPKIDFGYIPEYGTGIHRFWITSKIDDTLRIGESKTFCECLEFTFIDSVLPPGDSIAGIVKLSPAKLLGVRHWVPVIYSTKPRARIARIDVKAIVYNDPSVMTPIRIEPMVINTSWFREKGPKEFTASISNTTDVTIPLRLIEIDTTYFSLKFPVFLEPLQTKEIEIVLNEKGTEEEFEESITFEYIDNVTSERKQYTLPIKRRLFVNPE